MKEYKTIVGKMLNNTQFVITSSSTEEWRSSGQFF